MLDALRTLGCAHRDRAGAARHRPRRPAAGARGEAVPGQRRHRDASAHRRARGARRDPGRPLRAVRRAAHARAADRRSCRRVAAARLHDRLPRPAGLSAAARARGAGRPARDRAPDPRARRRLEPVPDRAAARAAAGHRRTRDRHRGRRRADLQALRRDHAQPARALRHRGRSATAGSASRCAPAAATAAPGAIHVEGDASSASYFVALGAIAAHGDAPVRIEGVGQRLDPGRHPLRRRRPGDGRAGHERPGLDRGAARPLAAAGASRSTAATSPTPR